MWAYRISRAGRSKHASSRRAAVVALEYKSALPDACCVQQLLDAFYATGTAVMGLKVWLPYSAVLLRLNSRALTRWLFAVRAVVADVL